MPETRNRYIHQALIGTPGNPSQDVLTVQYANSTPPPLATGAATAANQVTTNTGIDGLADQIGEVQASPTANTVLDRLKAIVTGLGSVTLASSPVVILSLSSSLNPDGTGINFSGSNGSTPPTSGSIGIYISACTSSMLNFDQAVYDLEIYSGSNCPYVIRLLEGQVKLSKEITR